MTKKILFTGVLALVFLAGCATSQIDNAISRHHEVANSIQLGDSKESVLSALLPTQKELPAKWSKSHESYKRGDDIIEIYYFRTARQPDGLKTDDEFTPYVFTNGSYDQKWCTDIIEWVTYPAGI